MKDNPRAKAGALLASNASRAEAAQAAVELLNWSILDLLKDGTKLQIYDVCNRIGLYQKPGGEARTHTSEMVRAALRLLRMEDIVQIYGNKWGLTAKGEERAARLQ